MLSAARRASPEGAIDLSPRVLTLGIIKINGFALIGREALTDEFCAYLLRKNWRVQLRRATIGPCVRFVITFDLAHPSGRLGGVELVPCGRETVDPQVTEDGLRRARAAHFKLLGQSLLEIGDDVFDVLDPDREPHHVGAGAGGDLLRVA